MPTICDSPNELGALLKDDETDLLLWESMPLSHAICGGCAARIGYGLIIRRGVPEGEKWVDWANQTLSPAHRVILMGLVRTPPEKRDRAAVKAGIESVTACLRFLMMRWPRPWFSGITLAPAISLLLAGL